MGGQPVLDTDYRQFLLGIGPCDQSELDKFYQVIEGLKLQIWYESIYGGGIHGRPPEPAARGDSAFYRKRTMTK